MYEVSKEIVSGGVNSGFRYRQPYPIYFKRAEGSRLWDIDGNEYVDFLVANGACILGHRDARVVEAVREQLETGLTVGLESELSLDVAQMLHKMIPSAEMVKLSNTGSEAVMHAFQIARGYTKKRKIVKTEGCYHGWQDEAHLSVHPKDISSRFSDNTPIPESEGYAPGTLSNVAVIPYNDAASLEGYLKANRDDVAAFIVEPVMFNSGCVLPAPGYLQQLREITEKNDVLLIFDEVVTGFRVAPGGAQQYYGVTPDVSIFAKAIANGFPLSAVVGRKDIISVTTPGTGSVAFAGTYNGSQPALAASKACLRALADGSVQKKLGEDSQFLRTRFAELAAEEGVSAQLCTLAGQFQVYFTGEPVVDYRSAARSDAAKYARMCGRLYEDGMMFHQSYLFHHGTSMAHDREDLERLMASFKHGLEDTKKP